MKISGIHLEPEVFTLLNGTAGVHTGKAGNVMMSVLMDRFVLSTNRFCKREKKLSAKLLRLFSCTINLLLLWRQISCHHLPSCFQSLKNKKK